MTGQAVIGANKRYRRDFLITMIIYVLMVSGGPFLLTKIEQPQEWMYAALAMGSAAPAAYVFVLLARYLKETDEYIRQRTAGTMLVAAGVTISFCFFWGFMELYQLVPNMWTFLVGPLFFASWLITHLIRGIIDK